MIKLGHVDTEGGPLLIVDANDRKKWNGVDGNDYDRACDLFDNHPNLEGLSIDLEETKGLLWEVSGPGTIEVFIGSSNLPVLIRSWLNDYGLSNREAAFESFSATSHASDLIIGNLTIRSGCIMILWATENASGLEVLSSSGKMDISGELAIENSVIAFSMQNGTYKFAHSVGENEYGFYRMLRMLQ